MSMRPPVFTAAGREKRVRREKEERLLSARAAVARMGYRAHKAFEELPALIRPCYADFELDFGPLHLTARHPRGWNDTWSFYVSIILPEDIISDDETLPAGTQVQLPKEAFCVRDEQLLVCAALSTELLDALADLDIYVEQKREEHVTRLERENDVALYRDA